MNIYRYSLFIIFLNISINGFSQIRNTTCDNRNNYCVINTAVRKSTSSTYFNWKIVINTRPVSLINNIDSVVYYLHKTFNPRIITRRRSDLNNFPNFSLSKSGWGEFNVLVKIYLHNSRTPLLINHMLQLK